MWCCAAAGLYALVPLIADLRAIQTRYGWISDLLNILDAPFENLVNANYFALPQVIRDRGTEGYLLAALSIGLSMKAANVVILGLPLTLLQSHGRAGQHTTCITAAGLSINPQLCQWHGLPVAAHCVRTYHR